MTETLKTPILLATLFLLSLSGCGPREIGEGTASTSSAAPESSAADLMRQPVIGMDRTQRLLYWQNRPDVAAKTQDWRLGLMRKYMGLKPAPDDPAYRETPKQRSPFRQ